MQQDEQTIGGLGSGTPLTLDTTTVPGQGEYVKYNAIGGNAVLGGIGGLGSASWAGYTCLKCFALVTGLFHVCPQTIVYPPTDDARKLGIGGAPTRATFLPTGAAERKKFPIASGVLDYFPDALCAISHNSWRGNEQHNPGQPLHWNRSKSGDEDDTLIRHFMQRGTVDVDGVPHSVKLAWRALAFLQKEIEANPAIYTKWLASTTVKVA